MFSVSTAVVPGAGGENKSCMGMIKIVAKSGSKQFWHEEIDDEYRRSMGPIVDLNV